MRVAALVHMYPALGHHAGAEWMLHTILRSMVNEGDTCVAYVDSTAKRLAGGRWDGVGVCIGFPDAAELGRYDVAITHLDESLVAGRLAVAAGVPLVHLVHNDYQLSYHGISPRTCQLAVFNSEWLAGRVRWPGESITCQPPVLRSDYACKDSAARDSITLVSLSREKGSQTLYDLAGRMPGHNFIGVVGSYGTQHVRFDLPNVMILKPTPHIARDVYRRTRVLIMPSSAETWGRCAAEAAMSGIPTIASDTPGLRECLAESAVAYLNPGDVAAWERHLRALDAPGAYQAASRLTLARADEVNVDSEANLRRIRRRLQHLADA